MSTVDQPATRTTVDVCASWTGILSVRGVSLPWASLLLPLRFSLLGFIFLLEQYIAGGSRAEATCSIYIWTVEGHLVTRLEGPQVMRAFLFCCVLDGVRGGGRGREGGRPCPTKMFHRVSLSASACTRSCLESQNAGHMMAVVEPTLPDRPEHSPRPCWFLPSV